MNAMLRAVFILYTQTVVKIVRSPLGTNTLFQCLALVSFCSIGPRVFFVCQCVDFDIIINILLFGTKSVSILSFKDSKLSSHT